MKVNLLRELKSLPKVWDADYSHVWVRVFGSFDREVVYLDEVFPNGTKIWMAARKAATRVFRSLGNDIAEAHVGAHTAFLLAALDASDECPEALQLVVELLEEEYGKLWAQCLLIDVGGRPGGGIFGTYTEGRTEYDIKRKKIIVSTRKKDVGRWIGRKGIRIRPIRAMLRIVGWDIEIEGK